MVSVRCMTELFVAFRGHVGGQDLDHRLVMVWHSVQTLHLLLHILVGRGSLQVQQELRP